MQAGHSNLRGNQTAPTAGARRAFSLVELLVAIAIIALLISILLPVLGKARSMAHEKACASNLRQIGQMLFMYANDNRGALPVEPTEHNPHPFLLQVALEQYQIGPMVFYCPEAEAMEPFANSTLYTPIGGTDSVLPTPENIAAGNIGYIYWSYLANKPSGASFWRQKAFFIPRALTLTKATQVDPARPVPEAMPSERWVASDFFRQGARFPHARRHAQGVNVLYLDGHVDLVFGSPSQGIR